MQLSLVSCSDATGRRCRADPALVVQLITPGDTEAFEDAQVQLRECTPWWRDLPSLLGKLRRAPILALGRGERMSLTLDEAWHGLHFLFSGSAWQGELPAAFLLRGGVELGKLQVGAGPARWLDATALAAAKQALDASDDATLRARFDPDAMMSAQIYPEIWNREPLEEGLVFLLAHAGRLRKFLADAAHARLGCVIYLHSM